MKFIRIILSITWLIYCGIGIIRNYTHYSILDFIVIIVFAALPFVIYFIYRQILTSRNTITYNEQKNNPINNVTAQETFHQPNIPQATTNTAYHSQQTANSTTSTINTTVTISEFQ